MPEYGRVRPPLADNPDKRPRRSADQENDARRASDCELAQTLRRKKPGTSDSESAAEAIEFAALSGIDPVMPLFREILMFSWYARASR